MYYNVEYIYSKQHKRAWIRNVIVLTIFLLNATLSAFAQNAKPKRQRKSLRETIAVVDSLRLQMRYAADHGYM